MAACAWFVFEHAVGGASFLIPTRKGTDQLKHRRRRTAILGESTMSMAASMCRVAGEGD